MKKYFDALVNNEKLCDGVYFASTIIASASMAVMVTASYIKGVRRGCDIMDDYYDQLAKKAVNKEEQV